MRVLWFNNKNHLNKIEGNQNLADLIHDISMLITEEKNDGYSAYEVLDCRIDKATGYLHNRWIENEELAKKLIELKNEIKIALINAKKEGLKEGKNLLKLLNQGKITLDELQ